MLVLAFVIGCGSHPASQTPPPAASARVADGWKHFGAPFALASAVPASQVFADPGSHAADQVRIQGELTEVCQAMGCWAVVRDDQGHSMRITMADHGFGIDKDTAGKSCDAEGRLVQKKVDPETIAHYASEGGAAAPEAGQTEAWELVATGVSIQEG